MVDDGDSGAEPGVETTIEATGESAIEATGDDHRRARPTRGSMDDLLRALVATPGGGGAAPLRAGHGRRRPVPDRRPARRRRDGRRLPGPRPPPRARRRAQDQPGAVARTRCAGSSARRTRWPASPTPTSSWSTRSARPTAGSTSRWSYVDGGNAREWLAAQPRHLARDRRAVRRRRRRARRRPRRRARPPRLQARQRPGRRRRPAPGRRLRPGPGRRGGRRRPRRPRRRRATAGRDGRCPASPRPAR